MLQPANPAVSRLQSLFCSGACLTALAAVETVVCVRAGYSACSLLPCLPMLCLWFSADHWNTLRVNRVG